MRTPTHTEHGQAMPSVVAVVSVVAIVAALAAFFVGGAEDTELQARDQTASTPSTQPTQPTQPSGSDAAGTEGSGRSDREGGDAAGDDRGGAGTDKGTSRRDQEQAAKSNPTAGIPDVYVEVYNNSGISGLAGSTAARLQDGGWQVVGVDNWHGDIPASTVYHPDGMGSEASRLARTLGVTRVRGAVAPMKFDRLTVILTTDAA